MNIRYLMWLSLFINYTHTAEQPIIVGTTLDLSNGLKEEGIKTKLGIDLRFAKENRTGGINGRQLILKTLDDKYQPALALENVKLLMKETSIILSPMSSTTVEAFFDLVKQQKILVLFPSTGSPALYDSKIKNMILWRPSYDQIDRALVHYATQTLKAKKIAFFFQDDISGAGVRKHIEELKITSPLIVTHERNPLDLKKQAKLIKEYNPDAILFLSTSQAAMRLIKELGVQNLLNKSLIGTELGGQEFKNFLTELGLQNQYIDSQNLPNPKIDNLPIAQEYRKEMQLAGYKNLEDLDVFSFEAYVSADIFVYLLQEIAKQGKVITNDTIVEAIRAMKKVNLKGMDYSYDEKTDQLSQYIWLDTGKPRWLKRSL